MPLTGGVEIAFLDGKFVVDDVYVQAINDVTRGHPERFPYHDVMNQIGNWFGKQYLRTEQAKLRRDHLSIFGIER